MVHCTYSPRMEGVYNFPLFAHNAALYHSFSDSFFKIVSANKRAIMHSLFED